MLWRARERVARVLGNALNSKPSHDVLTMWRSASPRHGSMPELLLSGASRELRATNLGFRVPAPRTVLKTRTTEIRTERVEVQDPQTGQVWVYGSLDEVPADVRAKIAQARSTAQQSAHTKITVKDASGSTRTYDYVVAVATVFDSSGRSGGLRG